MVAAIQPPAARRTEAARANRRPPRAQRVPPRAQRVPLHAASHYALRGFGFAGEGAGVTILRREADAFLPALLEELGTPGGLEAVRASAAAETDSAFGASGTLRLYQPVHHCFNVVLLEACCAGALGEPRLDPAAIESAGIVVRRLRRSGAALVEERWLTQGDTPRGWGGVDGDQDPDPARRPAPVRSGNAEIDRRLAALLGPGLGSAASMAEAVAPLFVAPPAVCKAAGRTLLYGLLPVSSGDFSRGAPPVSDAALDEALAGVAGITGPFLDPAVAPLIAVTGSAVRVPAGAAALNDPFMRFLRLLMDLGAFDAGGDPAFLDALAAVTFTVRREGPDGAVNGAAFLRDSAARWRLEQDVTAAGSPFAQAGQAGTLEWRVGEQAAALRAGLRGLLRAQQAQVRAGEWRFTQGRRYVAHAFVRVRQGEGCPPLLVWAAPSRPFAVAPWHAQGCARPPVEIGLPDPFDRNALKAMKPNVSFRVPEKLFNFLQSDLSKLLDGDKPASTAGLAIDWICSFNIPVITLCAFIVLNIFLGLLNIVFQWLLFIKICIPVPKVESEQ